MGCEFCYCAFLTNYVKNQTQSKPVDGEFQESYDNPVPASSNPGIFFPG